jgi:serine/threonine-protein kinase
MAVATAKRILSPGTRIAGYCIEAEIGHGAMAVVYRAKQLNLDRPVALKILSDELAANHEFVSRFFNEARAAAALSHPHIVQAYDAGIADGGIHFFAMEYVEGETLLQRIRHQGHIRPGPGIALAIDIADALNYGWLRQGLTHGDIKPENIMINQAGESKLADFGLAKVAGHDFTGTEILLTPLYAAPETIRGEQGKGDCRSDIYAFGATLYHLFGGSPPFPGEKAQEVMRRQLTETLEPLRQRNPAVPGRVSDVVGWMLQKDAAQRPGDWEAVLAALREIRRVLTEPPPSKITATAAKVARFRVAQEARPRASAQRSRGVGKWVAVVGLLLLAGGAGFLVVQRGSGLGTLRPGGAAPGAAEVTSLGAVEPPAVPAPSGQMAPLAPPDGVRLARPAAVTPSPGESDGHAGAAALVAEATPPGQDASEVGGTLLVAAGGAAEAVLAQPPAARAVDPVQNAIVITPNDERADALVAYLGTLASFEYRFPLRIEAHMQAGQEWLLRFADDSTERATVTFIVHTVLPAVEEALPKLAANSGVLVGLKMPGREYPNCTVAAVDVKDITLREQTQYGVAARKVSWQRLDGPTALVLHLSQKVAMRTATWAERRPFLALLLLSRNPKLFDDAVKDLPEATEKADWERLRARLARAAPESKALRTWQKALEAHREGERTTAYRLLLELQATRSGVAERYGERAQRLAGELSAGVPDVAGGTLLRESAAQAAVDAHTALAKVLLASNRYGAADFPERSGMEALRRRILTGLPLEAPLLAQVRRQPQHLIVPFGRPVATGVPSLASRMLQAAKETGTEGGAGQTDALAALQGPALLELGDWAAAERLLSNVPDEALAALPPPGRAAAWFSRGLLESRFGTVSEGPITTALHLCSRELTGKADSEFMLLPQILALEYGLFLRSGAADLQPYLAGSGSMAPRGPSSELRARLILDLGALSLNRGQAVTAARLVPSVFAATGAVADWGLSDAELALLRRALAPSTDAKTLLAAMGALDRRSCNERHLRLVASTVLAWDAIDEGVWGRAKEWVSLNSMAYGPVGGTALYDLALGRIGQRLAVGDLKGAEETAAWALGLSSPCLAPYYARLVFARWGIARLQGGAGNRELGETVEAASCASRVEKAVARCFRGETQRDKAKDAVRGRPEGEFWLDWLLTIERLAGTDDKLSQTSGEHAARSRLPRAEEILASGLARWAARSDPQAPGADRNRQALP